LGGRGRQISEFKASLVYKVSSRAARATQKNPVLKKTKKRKKKKKKKKRKERKSKYEWVCERLSKCTVFVYFSFYYKQQRLANYKEKRSAA
jgi:hypothetical protein